MVITTQTVQPVGWGVHTIGFGADLAVQQLHQAGPDYLCDPMPLRHRLSRQTGCSGISRSGAESAAEEAGEA